MPGAGRRQPRAATCEDWDDDADTALPGSRTTAKVAIKPSQPESAVRAHEQRLSGDAIDSGYVSRADTLVSEPTSRSRRKVLDLKLDTRAIPERERQPYHIPQSAPAKPPTRRQSSSQGKGFDPEPHLVKTQYKVHPRGTCGVCDHYGKHIAIKQDVSRASSVAPPPPSPTSARQSTSRGVKDDDALLSRSRRPSSDRQPRPLSMASAHPMSVPYYSPAVYGPPLVASSGWTTPMTPTMSFNSPAYTYAPASPFPGSSFVSYQQFPQYADTVLQPVDPPSNRPSRRSSPVRRSSAYGDPVIRQSYPDGSTTELERVPSRESRPRLVARKSIRSVDHDRIAMPPPPPPKQQPPEVVLVRRPGNNRSKTYHPSEPTVRERHYESDHYDDEDYDVPKLRNPPSGGRDRRESPSRPPTSYRGPTTTEGRDRPALTRNYTTPTATTKVASSKVPEAPRRSTVVPVPLEQKEADIEEYLRRRSKTSSELTAEALHNLNKRNSSSKSETGSSYSHKSLQSSSKDSSGRGRSHTSGTRTSITLPGGVKMSFPVDYANKEDRPVSINVGGVVLSLSTEEKGPERVREQKAIERAPSAHSRESRKSFSSGISSKGKERDPHHPSRRPSYAEERAPSLRSSRQPSRAPSVSRPSYEYTTRRQSVDYKGYEGTMPGA